jgi:hypothetical protein
MNAEIQSRKILEQAGRSKIAGPVAGNARARAGRQSSGGCSAVVVVEVVVEVVV